MNKKKVIETCLIGNDSIETYPFKDKSNSDIAVIRHKSNGKWFALVFFLDDKLYLNLKCNPLDASILRDMYDYVTPAWHMNKKHWNKIEVSKTPKSLLLEMIKMSYELTL